MFEFIDQHEARVAQHLNLNSHVIDFIARAQFYNGRIFNLILYIFLEIHIKNPNGKLQTGVAQIATL